MYLCTYRENMRYAFSILNIYALDVLFHLSWIDNIRGFFSISFHLFWASFVLYVCLRYTSECNKQSRKAVAALGYWHTRTITEH